MEPASLRQTLLLIASFWSVFIAGAIFFVGAYFAEGLTNDTPTEVNYEFIKECIFLLTGFLLIVSTVISWFNSKLGGFLITLLAIGGAIFYLPGFLWVHVPMIIIGLLILYSFYNEK